MILHIVLGKKGPESRKIGMKKRGEGYTYG